MQTYSPEQINTPWFTSPFFDELLENSPLEECEKEKVKFFADNGYLIIDLNLDDFDQLSEDIIQNLAGEQAQDPRVQDAWCYLETVKTLACHPPLLKLLKLLYQREPIPFQTLNFSRGTEQATHSDLIHFSSLPQLYMAGIWIALEDVGPTNGPLHYYPGSHKLPVYTLYDIGLEASTLHNRNDQYGHYEAFIQKLVKNEKKQTVQLKKGQALIWAANLLHGGEPIQDPTRTRHTQVTHYYFSNCRYYNPLYSDIYRGKIAWKEIIDIRNKERISHVYQGKPISLPWKTRARYRIENSLRNSKLGRALIRKIKKRAGPAKPA